MVSCDESEEYLKMILGRFVGVCKRKSQRVNTEKTKGKGEDGSITKLHVDGTLLYHVSEFKYKGCVLNESGTDGAKCRKIGASRRNVAGAILFYLW